jgi:hypothetical protein
VHTHGPKGNAKKVEKKAEIVKAILEEVPIYKDAMRPAAREFGKAAAPAGKAAGETVAALAVGLRSLTLWSIASLAKGYESIKDHCVPRLAKILEDVPEERLVSPEPSVAVPALESFVLVCHEPTLADMYVKLLATSMDSQSAEVAHPAFAEIIRQMTPDEARIIKFMSESHCIPTIKVFTRSKIPPRQTHPITPTQIALENYYHRVPEMGIQNPGAMRVGLDNLRRLGLIEHNENKYFPESNGWDSLVNSQDVQRLKVRDDVNIMITKGGYYLTNFGYRFCLACVLLHGSPPTVEAPKTIELPE